MRHFPHADVSTYCRLYTLMGSLRPYPVKTLAHILTLFSPLYSVTDAQAYLRDRTLAEMAHRAALGNATAEQALAQWKALVGKNNPAH
jgi:hypothetical protein